MNEPDGDNMAIIRLSGQAEESNAIPAELLIQTLQGMQQLVYIAASDKEKKTLQTRFRVSADIERDYKLMCDVPRSGSYVMPLRLSDVQSGQLSLLPQFKHVFTKIDSFFKALSDGAQSVSEIFSNPQFAKRALREVRNFLPKADESWAFGYQLNGQQSERILSGESVRRIDDLLLEESPLESVTTITGELIGISFDERKVLLRYPPTSKIVECIYSEDLEDTMIQSRRGYVQVTGKFTLNSDGTIAKLTDISRIEPLDLSPLIFRELSYKKRRFHFRNVLKLTPALEEDSKQLLCVEILVFGISAFGKNRDELVNEISEQLNFVWNQYALCPDEELTPEAIDLKKSIRAAVEVTDAA